MGRPCSCDQCGSTRIELKSLKTKHKSYLRRKAWPYVYRCLNCRAECGLKTNTTDSVGMMADGQTRHARIQAHEAFDPIWRGKHNMSRVLAYKHLAAHMGLRAEDCHIGGMDKHQCRTVVTYSRTLRRRLGIR